MSMAGMLIIARNVSSLDSRLRGNDEGDAGIAASAGDRFQICPLPSAANMFQAAASGLVRNPG